MPAGPKGQKRRLVILAAGLVAPALAILTGVAVSSETLYVPVVHVLAVDGSYHRFPLKGTEKGMGRIECDLRKEAWLDHFGDGIAVAKNELAKTGQQGGMTITCEPLNGS